MFRFFVLVLLSAIVEKFSVSCMPVFFVIEWFLKSQRNNTQSSRWLERKLVFNTLESNIFIIFYALKYSGLKGKVFAMYSSGTSI